jgi:branched-chain amino acid aminotransferase
VIWTLRDGAFEEGAAVPVTDRGFRYGMSVFETVAVFEGRLLFWEEHLTRLHRAGNAAGFVMPEIPELSRPPQKNGLLRIYVTAGDGAPSAPVREPRVVVLFDEAAFPTDDDRARGLRVTISRAPVAPVLGGWKTGCYWPQVQAFAEARREGFDEAVVCNPHGGVMSASMANLFVVRNGRVLTPPVFEGARDGVVRDWVKTRLTVEEIPLMVEDLETAEECFLTNSRLGVVPVSAIEGRPLPSRGTGNHLADSYCEEILRQ